MTSNELSKNIVDIAFKIYTNLGPGLSESAYEEIMAHEPFKGGLRVDRQKKCIPMILANLKKDIGFQDNLIVESKNIIVFKSVDTMARVHPKQLLT